MRRAALLTSIVAAVLTGSAAAQPTVSGQIRLPGGEPAAGVAVELIAQTNAYDFGRLVLAGRHYPEPAARALTRNDGRFELEAPEAGMWHLYVAADGYRPMELNFYPLLGDRSVPALELIAETPVAVRVTGAGGEPLAGAHVRAEPPPGEGRGRSRPDDWQPAYRQVLTDERGAAVIGRGADESLQIYAIAAGYLEAERSGVKTGPVELRLATATPRQLRILSPRDEPVAGALVRLGERRWPIGLTDSDGLIELPLPAQGEPRVHVVGTHGERGEDWLELGGAPSAEPPTLKLVAPEPRTVRIVDRDTRSAIAGAFLWVGGQSADAVRVDSTGTHTLRAPADTSSLWIWGAAEGYLKDFAQIDRGAETTAAAELTLALQAPVRIRGRVVDESDRPVAEAGVSATVSPARRTRLSAWQGRLGLEPAVSDAGGRFEIGGLHPEVAYVLRAVKPGFASAELELPNPRNDAEKGVRLVLELGRVATGTVLSASGEPIAGARIRLTKSVGSGPMRRVMRARMLGSEDVEAWEAYSDEAGRFAVADLLAATFDLDATAPGYAKTELTSLEIPPGQVETELGEITLEPGAAIEGRVTDARGSAIEGAQVFATTSQSGGAFLMTVMDRSAEPAAVSDVNGFFTVPDRRPGERVDLAIDRAGYAQGRVVGVEAPTHQPVAVELNRSSRIRGEVVDASGRPIGGAHVWVQLQVTMGSTSMSRPGGRATTAEDGRFVIEEAAPGELELHVQAEGYRNAKLGSLVIEPERDLEGVRVEMEPGATVAGRVTDALGRPVEDAMVMVSEAGSFFSFGSMSTTDGEGRYRLTGVPPGRQSVTARHDDYQTTTRELEVELGDNQLDLLFEGGATISGRVVSDSGEPVVGAAVELVSHSVTGWDRQGSLSDTSGAYSIGGVPAGIFNLQAHKEGFATATVEGLEVGASDLPGVEIRLSAGSAIAGRLLGLEPSDYADVQVTAIKPPRAFSMGQVDRDGNYRIADLAPGDYTVYAQVGQSARMAQASATVVEGAGETLVDLEFESGLTLSGVVLSGGEPLGGAVVSAAGTDVASTSAGITTSAGRFELQGLEPGRHTLSVTKFDSGLRHTEELELASDRDVVVRVESAVLSGSVFDAADSRTLAGATVRLESADASSALDRFLVHSSTTTDSTGSFRFGQAAAGTHRVVAQKDGYAPAEIHVTVIDGLDQEGLEIPLEPTAGLRVFVSLPSGQPAPEFFAAVLDASGRSILSGVYAGGSDGTRLSIPPGAWELLVSARDTAVSSTPVTLPSDPIAIALRREALLDIRVPELEGDRTLATVKLIRPDGRLFRTVQWMWTRGEWSLHEGRASVHGLEPGPWTVTVETPDGRSWRGQASLAAGPNPELVLR